MSLRFPALTFPVFTLPVFRFSPLRWAVLVLAVGLSGPAVAPTADSSDPSDSPTVLLYSPPVVAPIIDPFRPPATFAGPGNRGLEYGTIGGEIVLASAAGVVTFAGPLASNFFITIQHEDGLRTSYSFVREVQVAVGQSVAGGSVLARAQPGFHFGVRIGPTYLDPELLLHPVATESSPARLVPITISIP